METDQRLSVSLGMILSENRFPPLDQVRGQAFSGSCADRSRRMVRRKAGSRDPRVIHRAFDVAVLFYYVLILFLMMTQVESYAVLRTSPSDQRGPAPQAKPAGAARYAHGIRPAVAWKAHKPT